MNKNIPFYTMYIDEQADGMDFMGLVDIPAHMKNYQTFADVKPQPIKERFDEEKRTVTGVAIAVDLPIYRNDSEIGEHYVVFRKKDTEIMWGKMMQNNYLHNINNMHDMNEPVQDITMLFCYQVDKKGGVYPEIFADQNIKDGSIIVSYKAHTQKAWDYIKKNNGFSIEGFFAKKPLKIKGQFSNEKIVFITISEVDIWDIEVIADTIELGTELHHEWTNEDGSVVDGGRVRAGEYLTPDQRTIQVDSKGVVIMIDGKIQEQMQIKKMKKMKKKTTVMSRLFKGKDKFESAMTIDNAEIFWEGELEEGKEITIKDDNNEDILAPEGDHTFKNEDGTMTIVSVDGNGLITTITIVEKEDDEIEEMTAEVIESLIKEVQKETKAKFEKQKIDFDKKLKEFEIFKTAIKELQKEIDIITSGEKKKFVRKGAKKIGDWKKHC
jgi:hypothetical protein